jgi:hypothetical protein
MSAREISITALKRGRRALFGRGSRDVPVRARVGLIVVVVYGFLACALAGAGWSKGTPKATSREYKIRLRAADFADETERATLWRTVAGKKADSAGRGPALDEKSCRRVSYFDTASQDLERAGWLIRRREKFREQPM